MGEHAIKRHMRQRKPTKHPLAQKRGARILVLTDDPRRSVLIVPGCHLDSMRREKNAYYFQDGNALVGMVVSGGTVEYDADDRTYVVQLTDRRHTTESSFEHSSPSRSPQSDDL